VRATTGSFCWNSADGGICADSAYPLRVRGRLPVEPRERVRLRIRDHARRVHVSLVRVKSPRSFDEVGWGTRAKRIGKHLWRFRLPGDLQRANVLDVFAEYRQGDASFWAGLAPRRR
jgi:hypothetical protein